MPPGKSTRTPHTTAADSTRAVDEFMNTLEHPFKDVVSAIRRFVLGVDGSIAEGIKWNVPSFRTTEYFATLHLRQKRGVGVVLHLGAKTRDLPAGGVAIEDESQSLKWLGKDRAMIVFDNLDDFNTRKPAFDRIVRQWILHV